MKYKLINRKTSESHLCDKVTIDGFDYYVSDEKEVEEYNKVYFAGQILTTTYFDSWFLIWNFVESSIPPVLYKRTPPPTKVIATNNPNIDIPKVVDEVDKLAYNHCDTVIPKDITRSLHYSFKCGYNKSQETHPFSEEDMIEFNKWICDSGYIWNWRFNLYTLNMVSTEEEVKETGKSTKELLQLWKEQKPKIVYYG